MSKLTREQRDELRKYIAGLGELPPRENFIPEGNLYRPNAIAHACFEVNDLLDTCDALEARVAVLLSHWPRTSPRS